MFAWAFVNEAVFQHSTDFLSVVRGCGWFVTAIMVYYIVLYAIGRYAKGRLPLVFLLCFAIITACYLTFDGAMTSTFNLQGSQFPWVGYFLPMFFGGIVGVWAANDRFGEAGPWKNLLGALVCAAAFYGIQAVCGKFPMFLPFKVVCLLPLCLFTLFLYRALCAKAVREWFASTAWRRPIYWAGTISLEVYLCQGALIRLSLPWRDLFPLNILVLFVAIFATAYAVHILSQLFRQIFLPSELDWRSMFRL